MRIGVDARPVNHSHTGIGRYFLNVFREIVELTPETEWFLYSDKPKPQHFAAKHTRWRNGSGHLQRLSSLTAQRNYARWAVEDRLDVFWSPRHHLPLLLKSIPTIVTIHDLVWLKSPTTMARLGNTIERLLMPPSIQMASRVLTPSQSTAQDLREHYPECANKILVTPLAACLSQRDCGKRKSRSEQRYALFVGTLEPRKNLQRIVEAFELAWDQDRTDIGLKIAGGNGWKNTELHAAIRSAQSRGLPVQLTMNISDEDLACLYRDCEFLVAPSLYEGFGLQIVEAFAFGKPVITSNLSSMPEVTGNAGLFVNPEDTAELSNAICTLANNDKLATELRSNAAARSRIFDWHLTAKATLQALGAVTTASATR